MARARIYIAKAQIVEYFDSLPQHVFNRKELGKIFDQQHANWRLASGMLLAEFIDYLCKQSELHRINLSWVHGTEAKMIRYVWREASPEEVALSLYKESYLSHYSAMALHELTDQVPKVIYVNVEQAPHPSSKGELEQDRIHAAFARPVRETGRVAKFRNYQICVINGKHTGQLGVINVANELNRSAIRLTDLERTLIDIAVRPNYSGGVFEVLKAYERARSRGVSINRLVSLLKKLDYVYPYHQVIGFYLERAGYSDDDLRLLEKIPMNFDFYLAHQVKDPKLSTRWHLFYPQQMA